MTSFRRLPPSFTSYELYPPLPVDYCVCRYQMAGRGTDIKLGGSARGIARALARGLLFAKLGLLSVIDTVSADHPASSTAASTEGEGTTPLSGETAAAPLDPFEGETDADVLALPTLARVALALRLRLPADVSPAAELALRRAVISALDTFEGGPQPGPPEIDRLLAAAEDAPLAAPESRAAEERLLRAALARLTAELEAALQDEAVEVKRLGASILN